MHTSCKHLLMLGLVAALGACGGDGGSTGTQSASAEGSQFNATQGDQSGAPINAPFSSEISVAPEDGSEIRGVVRLEVRGAQMENVELLPASGYEPKYGIFNISEDKSIAWLDLDTARLPNGPIEVRVSAFDVPAGRPGAQEIIAMPARTWSIDNPAGQSNEPFEASVASAPADGAAVSGIVRLEVRGNGIANAELLPATGYSPRLGVFNVSEDKTYAWLDFDTRSLPDGERDVRISAFNVMAGQPDAREIVAMPARSWNFSNDASDAFTATVTMAPAHGAFIDGTTRLEVRGSGLENVELLPAYGYEPKLGAFTISPDKTYAYLDVNAEDLPQAVFYARISAFNAPAGSATAREIIAMPPRQWTTPIANSTPAPGPLTDIRFTNPSDIAADANGNLYVVDGGNSNGQIRQIAPDGSVNTLVSEDGFTITDLAVTPVGDVFYSKSEDPYRRVGAIWQIENGTPVRVTSEEVEISDMVFDPSSGNLYVGVWTSDGPEVKEVRQDDSMTTLFSIDETFGAPIAMTVHNGVLWLGWRDGPYPMKYFRWSSESGLEEIPLAVEYVDNMVATESGVYFAGYNSDKFSGKTSCAVNLLDPDTLEATRVVAGGEEDSCIGTGYQSDMTQASDGNLYVNDYSSHTISKITPDGEVSTYAGVPPKSGG